MAFKFFFFMEVLENRGSSEVRFRGMTFGSSGLECGLRDFRSYFYIP